MKETDYMALALSLAKRAIGLTSPNPLVGAVVVRGKEIVGTGYHKRAGLPHAEIIALGEAGEKAKGSTLYVTLEPCVHYGRTPPCVDSIVRSGIKRVVIAMTDPNPLVSGKGIEALRRAGLQVKTGVLEQEARRLNEAYCVYMEKGRPFFIVKGALSLDGKIATRTLDSKWITNEVSRAYVNRLRGIVDGIMVGINTVVADNPLLIPRLSRPRRYPLRVVLDSGLRIPLSCEIVKTSSRFRTIVFCTEPGVEEKVERLTEMGVEVVRVAPDEAGKVSLRHVAEELGRRQIISVLVEGGGEVNWSLLKEGFVDKLLLFFAPLLIGGKQALSFLGGRGVDFVSEARRVEIGSIRRLKGDILVEAYPKG